jgi:hypothetical protein
MKFTRYARVTMDSPQPASALLASFHSGRWVFIQMPAAGNVVCGFGQQEDQQLLEERAAMDLSGCVAEQPSVSADFLHPGLECPVTILIEGDGVVGIGDDLFPWRDAVGYVGMYENRMLHQILHPFGQVSLQLLDEPTEVYDLMIAPVTDVRPEIVGLGNLPVDSPMGEIR